MSRPKTFSLGTLSLILTVTDMHAWHWEKLSLPTLQKTFVNFCFHFAWGLGIEKWWGFVVNFCGLRFPGNKARKVLGNVGENSEQDLGQKFEK